MIIAFPFVFLLLLLFAGLLIAGLINRRTRVATGIIAAALAAAVTLGGVVLVWYAGARRVNTQYQEATVTTHESADPGEPIDQVNRRGEGHIDWSARAAEQLPASSYPSQRAAAEGIATQIVDRVNAVRELDRPVTHLYLTAETQVIRPSRSGTSIQGTGGIDATVMNAIESRLREAWPEAKIEHGQSVDTRDAQQNPVAVSIQLSRTPEPDVFGQSYNGAIRATVKGPQRSAQAAVVFEDKPWVEQFEAFTSAHRDHRWLVGRSDEPSATETEAQDRALRDAAAQLEPIVREKLGTQTIEGAKLTQRPGWLRQMLVDRLRNSAGPSSPVIDRFTQRFARPYGDVYATQLLVGVNDPALAQLARDANQQLAGYRRTTWTTITSVGGLLITALAIYLVLNALTRGYYAGRLRVATALIMATGLGLLVMMLT